MTWQCLWFLVGWRKDSLFSLSAAVFGSGRCVVTVFRSTWIPASCFCWRNAFTSWKNRFFRWTRTPHVEQLMNWKTKLRSPSPWFHRGMIRFVVFKHYVLLVHGQVTIIFVVSVCLSLCLCRVFLSRLRSDLDQTCYMSGSSCPLEYRGCATPEGWMIPQKTCIFRGFGAAVNHHSVAAS